MKYSGIFLIIFLIDPLLRSLENKSLQFIGVMTVTSGGVMVDNLCANVRGRSWN